AIRSDLERLVRIPSVSAAGFDPSQVRRSAEAAAELLEAAGLDGVRLLELDGAHPAVFGEVAAPAGAPTVLLYAHHDVQPPGDESDWSTSPFQPTEREGRLYGRGTSDDKCGIVLHTGALLAHDGKPPAAVKVFLEGEEEIGSLHLADFLDQYGELLGADAIVIADSENWRVGQPALTTSLRGLVDCVVEVRTLDHGVHSGQFGGAFPDALTVLVRLLATLHDERGEVAVPGLVAGESDPLDLTEAELRSQAGVVEGVETIGQGSLTSRLWTRPACSVLAIDAPPIGEAINQLVPVARAKVSLRLAPGDDSERALEALAAHLEANTPWGARVMVARGPAGRPFSLDATGPSFDAFRDGLEAAWGTEAVDIGVGGSIPFVGAFSEAYPDASILLTGVGDPLSRAHGPDESVDLGELRRGTVAEAIALRRLAA
ncbi:MAG: dipeptidase, partial [Acidimicrobiia bacterium]